MGQVLNNNGIHVQEIRSISDDRAAILQTVEECLSSSDLVLMTGGLGPTKDDITKQTLADYFGCELAFHEPSFRNIETLFAQYGRTADERYRRQCWMPTAADILINKRGTASGTWFEKDGRILVSMPGVPREMRYLVEAEVLPRLRAKKLSLPIRHRTLLTTGKGETDLSEILEDFEAALPTAVKLAYLPNTKKGQVRLRLTAIGPDEALLEQLLDEQGEKLYGILDDLIFGEGEQSMEAVVAELLLQENATIATAESCTGGFIAHRLTRVAGASAYFKGSVVAYSNTVKQELLGVQESTLEQEGAVSQATVEEMLRGLLQRFDTDYGIAISGIAGPTGERPGKPVGTIWVAVGNKEAQYSKRLQLGKERLFNIHRSSMIALNILRKFILNKK